MMSLQDGIAFTIVSVAIGVSLRHFYRQYLVSPLSLFFLKRGRVALAMRIRGAGAKTDKDCGGDCSCD